MELVLLASTEKLKEKFRSIQTAKDVADLLEINSNTLNYHLRKVADSACYTTFKIPKKSGGIRSISAPSTTLKIIQQKLNNILRLIYEPRRSTHGFVLERSIVTNARRHCNRRFILNIDIMDFFPSINFGRVRGLFINIPYEMNPAVATILARICCFNNELPQGAPTSPIVANMICRRMDRQLEIFASQHRCAYTRYADDITLSTSKWAFPEEIAQVNSSGDVNVGTDLSRIINDNGFSINPEKVRLRNNSQRQEVTGLTTNRFPNVQRKYVRNIRAMLHAWGKFGLEAATKEYRRNHETGYRSPYKHPPSFEQIAKGKINFLGMVKGKDDPIYLNFLRQWEKLRLKPIWEALEPEPSLETAPVPTPVTTIEPTLEAMPELKEAADKDTWKLLINYMRHISPTSTSPSIPISTIKNLNEPEIKVHSIDSTADIDSVRVCLVQLDYSVKRQEPLEEFGYILTESCINTVMEKVFSALAIARDEKVNIVCFPELSIDKDWLDKMQEDFKDIIIIAGSHYHDRFNICPVLISGKRYLVKKINPSPMVEDNKVIADRNMRRGEEIHIFHTKFGSFAVLICLDYRMTAHYFLNDKEHEQFRVDMIINPCLNSDVTNFQKNADLDCQKEPHFPYILQTNILMMDEQYHDGTCIIGYDHKVAIQMYEQEHLRPKDDKIDYKLVEAAKDKENIIIANLDIKAKKVELPRKETKMTYVRRYLFENNAWRSY